MCPICDTYIESDVYEDHAMLCAERLQIQPEPFPKRTRTEDVDPTLKAVTTIDDDDNDVEECFICGARNRKGKEMTLHINVAHIDPLETNDTKPDVGTSVHHDKNSANTGLLFSEIFMKTVQPPDVTSSTPRRESAPVQFQMQKCPICQCEMSEVEILRHINKCAEKQEENQATQLPFQNKDNVVNSAKTHSLFSEIFTKAVQPPGDTVASQRLADEEDDVMRTIAFADALFVEDYEDVIHEFDCMVCREPFPVESMYTLGCGVDEGNAVSHRYCYECLRDYINHELEMNTLPTCPDKNVSGCTHLITQDEIMDVMVWWRKDEALYAIRKLEKLQLQECLSQTKYFKCPNGDCGNAWELATANAQRVKCDSCNGVWCTSCGQRFHKNSHCLEILVLKADQLNRRINGKEERDRQLQLVHDEMKSIEFITANCTPCPKCGVAGTDKTDCDHMTCPQCKHEWCWRCLGPVTHTKERGLTHVVCEPEKRKERVLNTSVSTVTIHSTCARNVRRIL
jgi:hypothetical protein